MSSIITERPRTSPRRLALRSRLFALDPLLKRLVLLPLPPMFLQNLSPQSAPSHPYTTENTRPTDSNSFNSVSGLLADLFARALVKISEK